MEARRIPAPLLGSNGRCGPKKRGFWRGLAEMVDLKEILEGETVAEEERERWVSEAACVGILTLFRC